MNLFSRHIGELWQHRALLCALVARDLKGRYRGSFLGFLWTFLNPLLLLLVYALVFSVYFRIKMENYAVFMFIGLLPWIFFSSALLDGSSAVTDGGSLVTKVLFPLQILPAVKVLSAMINYLLSLPILAVFMLANGVAFRPALLAFPLVAFSHLLFSFGCALLLSTITVFMRDTKHILGNMLTLWFFVTPVLYPLTQIPAQFRFLVKFNPAASFTLAYHDIFFWGRWPDWTVLAALTGLGLLLLFVSAVVFENNKEYFAEKI